jgi:hypothetical protein
MDALFRGAAVSLLVNAENYVSILGMAHTLRMLLLPRHMYLLQQRDGYS